MNNNFGGQTMSTPSQGQLINVVLVPDIDDIDWYPINPGGSVLFLNTAMTGFRLKTREQNGFPGPERRWKVEEVTPPPQSSGEVEAQEWMLVSDYTPVETGMTFTYTGCLWFYLNIYDDTKTLLNTIYIYNDATADENDSNTGHGTLSGAKLPANAAYVRITATGASSQYLSLIRTA